MRIIAQTFCYTLLLLIVASILALPIIALGAPPVEFFSTDALEPNPETILPIPTPTPQPQPLPQPDVPALRLEIDPVAAADAPAGRYRVTAYSGRHCKHCKQAFAKVGNGDSRVLIEWAEAELPEIVRSRLKQPYPFPVFTWLTTDNRIGWPAKWDLYSLDQLVAMCEANHAIRDAEPLPVMRRWAPARLRDVARAYTGPTVAIDGMSPLWHLTHPPHGYTPDELAGLTDAELLAIHSADHYGKISPQGERSIANSLPPPLGDAAASRAIDRTSAAGSIHGRAVIAGALARWRKTIGDGTVSFQWDRTGAQTLPLLRLSSWNPAALYGRSGAVTIIATGAKSLPVTEATVDYKIIGDELRLRGETVLDAGLLRVDGTPRSLPQSEQSVGMIDPISLIGAASMIWSLLHPQADLTLPGSIRATATMHGDELQVTFVDPPSVRIVVLFTFALKVESVSISDRQAVVKFGGSRIIRQKTFTIAD